MNRDEKILMQADVEPEGKEHLQQLFTLQLHSIRLPEVLHLILHIWLQLRLTTSITVAVFQLLTDFLCLHCLMKFEKMMTKLNDLVQQNHTWGWNRSHMKWITMETSWWWQWLLHLLLNLLLILHPVHLVRLHHPHLNLHPSWLMMTRISYFFTKDTDKVACSNLCFSQNEDKYGRK